MNSITPPQLFAVAVRVIGLLSLLYLLGDLFLLVGGGLPILLIVRYILWALVSVYMLRGAPALVSFAYGRVE